MSSGFDWTPKREQAAFTLARGESRAQAAEAAGVSERSVYLWLNVPEFVEEVDRLTLMIDIASRAHRLRIANRVIRQMVKDDQPIPTMKDLLDWLKYAQSETDGVKLDMTALLNAYRNETGND